MCLSFFFAHAALVLMIVHPFTHSFPLFTFRLYIFSLATIVREFKKKMQFRSDCLWVSANRTIITKVTVCSRILSLLLMVYFCHHIASFTMNSATVHSEEKAFSVRLTHYTLIPFIIVVRILVCLLSIFAPVFKIQPYVKVNISSLVVHNFTFFWICFVLVSFFSHSVSLFNLLIWPSYYDKTFEKCVRMCVWYECEYKSCLRIHTH